MDAYEDIKTAVKKRDKEWPQYSKRRKKLRKQLIKAAKQFKDFDFAYMIDVIEPMIRMYFNLHSRPNVVVYDTRSELNNYQDLVDSLARCQYLLTEYRNTLEDDDRIKEDILKDLFTVIGGHICQWWE